MHIFLVFAMLFQIFSFGSYSNINNKVQATDKNSIIQANHTTQYNNQKENDKTTDHPISDDSYFQQASGYQGSVAGQTQPNYKLYSDDTYSEGLMLFAGCYVTSFSPTSNNQTPPPVPVTVCSVSAHYTHYTESEIKSFNFSGFPNVKQINDITFTPSFNFYKHK
jgi:hypothetical protein